MNADRSFADLLDCVAARTPAPGGGSAAAWACALAASLAEMAAAFDRPPGTEVRDRARTLRTYALELAERDQDAYAGVLEALKLPESAPERPGRVQAALSAAADGPLALARAAGEVAGLAAQLALTGNPHLVGDATAAALLAEAATRAATRLVELNLSGLPGDPRLQVARELAELAADARARALEG